ncbi:unnamed protein product [Prunus brigantina]
MLHKHLKIQMLYKNRFSLKECLQEKYQFSQLQLTSVIFHDTIHPWAQTTTMMYLWRTRRMQRRRRRRRIGRPKVMIATVTKIIIVQMMNNVIYIRPVI